MRFKKRVLGISVLMILLKCSTNAKNLEYVLRLLSLEILMKMLLATFAQNIKSIALQSLILVHRYLTVILTHKDITTLRDKFPPL